MQKSKGYFFLVILQSIGGCLSLFILLFFSKSKNFNFEINKLENKDNNLYNTDKWESHAESHEATKVGDEWVVWVFLEVDIDN